MFKKKTSSLTRRFLNISMAVLVVSNLVIGLLSYTLLRNQLVQSKALEAKNVAISVAVRIDGGPFKEIMQTLEKNDYWYEVNAYTDKIAEAFGTAYIYILDSVYTDEVVYFSESSYIDEPYELGTTDIIEGVYADEMFETIRTGEPSNTEPYPSGEYGDMVSGFAAITDADDNVVGVVGVDFYYGDTMKQLTTFTITLVCIILAFLVVCYIFISVTGNKLAGKPLVDLDESAKKLSVGDMNINLDINSKTEIGRLADSFTRMIEGMKTQIGILESLSRGDLTPDIKLRGKHDSMGYAISRILSSLNELFLEINNSAIQVSSGARQISENAHSLAEGANEQTAAVQRLSASISEMTSKANKTLETAAKTNSLADEIKDDAQTGAKHMDNMTLAVKEITDASESINKIIKVIDDIAFQTNILALNAAVEAARAGQHGKGFAVVAEEVRSLASRSAEAAKDTEKLIMDSIEKTQAGARIAAETAGSFERITNGINDCANMVNEIAGAFEDQIQLMSSINDDVEEVLQVVHKNSAAAQESAAASKEMSDQSVTLEEMISQFKLSDKTRSKRISKTNAINRY